MNVLIFTDEVAQSLIASQDGQHRLGPVALTDSRWFLMDDILSEPLFEGRLDDVPYTTSSMDAISHLMPSQQFEQPAPQPEVTL
jgi:hypothetical protein